VLQRFKSTVVGLLPETIADEPHLMMGRFHFGTQVSDDSGPKNASYKKGQG
jgi:hypothetical protein